MADLHADANGKLRLVFLLEGAEADQLRAALADLGIPIVPADAAPPSATPSTNGPTHGTEPGDAK